jgi:hypothetical protein
LFSHHYILKLSEPVRVSSTIVFSEDYQKAFLIGGISVGLTKEIGILNVKSWQWFQIK